MNPKDWRGLLLVISAAFIVVAVFVPWGQFGLQIPSRFVTAEGPDADEIRAWLREDGRLDLFTNEEGRMPFRGQQPDYALLSDPSTPIQMARVSFIYPLALLLALILVGTGVWVVWNTSPSYVPLGLGLVALVYGLYIGLFPLGVAGGQFPGLGWMLWLAGTAGYIAGSLIYRRAAARARERGEYRRPSMAEREAQVAYLFIVPTFVIVFGLIVFPAISTVWISFHEITLGNLDEIFQAPYVGLDNFRQVVDHFNFWPSVRATVIISFAGTAVTILMGLVASLLLNQKFRGQGLARGLFLFSYVAPIISVAFIWRWMLNPRNGIINFVLIRLGILDQQVAWTSQWPWAIIAVIFFTGWRYFPFAMLMILARLQAIDETLYEAAVVDGASVWQKFWYITLPELRYVLGTVTLLRFIWTVNKFDDVFLLTGGNGGTRVLPVLVYDFSFGRAQGLFGPGSAAGMFLFLALLLVIGFYLRVMEL